MNRHRAIEDEALDWLMRKDEPDWSDAEQAGLDVWLGESEAHKAAYWRAEHGWREADRIRSLGAQDNDVADIQPPARRWLPVLIAASLVAAVGVGTYAISPAFRELSQPPRMAKYDTPIGGRRIVPLADGSKVELNTATVVRAAVSPRSREVWLDSGEAYFEVAHHEGRPFLVHAGKQTVTVLGTKFSVRRDGGRVIVNVLEGRVRVDNGQGGSDSAAIISAGDFAVARGPSTLIATNSEDRVERALGWRAGMLGFDQQTLSEVVAEFNRYNRKPIIIADAETAQIPIGGTFQASNVDAFVRLLRDAYGLKIDEDADRIKISH